MTIPGETEPNTSEARARLRVVGQEPDTAGEGPPARHRWPRSFWIACALALAVVVLWLWLGSSLAKVRALEADNAALSAELATTREVLAAHRARLDDVRSQVGELRQRIGSLDALLATEPGAHAPPQAPQAAPRAR